MFTPTVFLQFNVNTNTAVVVDNTAYEPTIDFTQVGVVGTFTLTGPDGVAVIVGGTIDLSGGDTESASFALPEDSLEAILNGSYTLVYTPTFTVSLLAVDSFTAPDQVTIASVDWVNIFDEVGASSQITIASATTPANDGLYDVESAVLSTGDTVFTLDTAGITSEAGGSATISFVVTYNTYVNEVYGYTGCDETTPTAEVTVYCNTTQFGQIIFQDTTVLPAGQVRNTRLWNISYPGNLTDPATPADVTDTNPTVTINTLATGTWTWRLTYNVTVTQSDGLVYTYISQSEATEVRVTCTTLCSARCGIESLYQQYGQALNGGQPINAFSKYVSLVNNYILAAQLAQECGDQDKFEDYMDLIVDTLNLAGVDCNCGCSGDDTETGNHWINNAGFSSQTEIEQLITDVTALQAGLGTAESDIVTLQSETATNTLDIQTVTGFANALAGDVAATAAYNAIVADLAIAFSTGANYNAQLGEVQAGIDALNPDDPNFDDSVDLLESSVLSIDTGLANLDIFVQGIITDINTFNANFPTYNTLFNSALAQLGSVAGFIAAANALSTTLLTSLQNLTAVTYAADIAGILADLANLQSDVNSLITYQNLTNSSVNGIYFALGQLIPIVLQNQSDIAALSSQQSVPEIFAQASVNELQTTVAGNIPAQYFKGTTVGDQYVSGYVSIKSSGRDTSINLCSISIYNQTTSQTVATLNITSSNSSFEIDAMLIWVTGNTFTLAGSFTQTTGGVTSSSPIYIAGIAASKVLPGTVNRLVLQSNLATTEFFGTQIIGIKLY